ncbi:MAG TPA: hypothetical protein VFP33_05060 [Gallionella sp.]|nr:hypothetical protein [Gallionella sp.]
MLAAQQRLLANCANRNSMRTGVIRKFAGVFGWQQVLRNVLRFQQSTPQERSGRNSIGARHSWPSALMQRHFSFSATSFAHGWHGSCRYGRDAAVDRRAIFINQEDEPS